jgi:hypothetical protein
MTCRSGKSSGLHGRYVDPLHIGLKAKISTTDILQVAGWRPSTPSPPGGLILAEDDQPIAVATLAIADQDRQDLLDLLDHYGLRHPTGTVTIPDERLIPSSAIPIAPHPRPSARRVRHSGPNPRATSPSRLSAPSTGQG